MASRISVVLVAIVLGVSVSACGGDSDTSGDTTVDETTTETETTTNGNGTVAAGQSVFIANCGTCHTLSDAGTSGSVGPVLDGAGLSADAVEEQVRNGGGGMPAFEGQLTDEEIQEVAAYVAAASSG